MNYAEYEEIQVTQLPDQVHCLTKDGWKLLEIVTAGEVAMSHQDLAEPGGQCGNCSTYHSGGSQVLSGSVVVNKPVFVLGLSKDKTVSDLRDDLESNKGTVEYQKSELKRLERALKETDANLEGREREIELLRKSIERNEKDLKKKDLLEGHLQKAKALVGDRDWKREVLGEKEEKCSPEKQ
jgi:hypothetical protein